MNEFIQTKARVGYAAKVFADGIGFYIVAPTLKELGRVFRLFTGNDLDESRSGRLVLTPPVEDAPLPEVPAHPRRKVVRK